MELGLARDSCIPPPTIKNGAAKSKALSQKKLYGDLLGKEKKVAEMASFDPEPVMGVIDMLDNEIAGSDGIYDTQDSLEVRDKERPRERRIKSSIEPKRPKMQHSIKANNRTQRTNPRYLKESRGAL
ncbi:hypothetical protein BC939DRAFT_501188 [Gamsiella multidivaricata]|uniref:uncharacterized protein n=1 Tax=Gamsiella multidivaricata TaxID=101098 RepID=UPI00221E9268|nr:uncharacterized protein BC939DRAFT_501188 [Gamsiella multidivaricata]KAI7827655.1 hypothetical protein BC939DRAFT_501188 [Gamsiella multidivaricata]